MTAEIAIRDTFNSALKAIGDCLFVCVFFGGLIFFFRTLCDWTRKPLPPNQLLTYKTKKRLLFSDFHFPTLHKVCLFLLWFFITSLRNFPFICLVVAITVVLGLQNLTIASLHGKNISNN